MHRNRHSLPHSESSQPNMKKDYHESTKFKQDNLTPKSLNTLKNLGVIRCGSVFNIFEPFVSSWLK